MKPWVIYGLSHKLTEAFSKTKQNIKGVSKIFRKSLHVFVVDVSNDNELNLEISALQSPQYNPHRFGIFFTESPRHADILLVLGKLNPKMEEPLRETINQLPEPFGIIVIEDQDGIGKSLEELKLPNVVAYFKEKLTAKEILSVLLNVMEDRDAKVNIVNTFIRRFGWLY